MLSWVLDKWGRVVWKYIIISREKMLEDKIQHSLIKINQLTSEKEDLRYIVPLYFNAVLPLPPRSSTSTTTAPTIKSTLSSLIRFSPSSVSFSKPITKHSPDW